MKPNSEFVEQLFKIVDKDASGRVTFEEFFQFVTLLVHGTEEEKAVMLFDLYDIDGNGFVDLDELYKMLMLSAQGERLQGGELKQSVETLLQASCCLNSKVHKISMCIIGKRQFINEQLL